MDALELKRLKAEYKRVDAAKEDMEYRIEDLLAQISRLKENILVQEKRLKELEPQVKGR